MTYWSGIVNEADLCHIGGTPHGLTDVLGLRSEEIDGLCKGETNHFLPLEKNAFFMKDRYECSHLCDLVHLDGAKPLMTYAENFYKGYPALTVNNYGSGLAYYVCADAETDFYLDLYRNIISEQHIPPVMDSIPEGIEISSRTIKNTEYVFVQNFTEEPICIRLPNESEILFGCYDGTIQGYSSVIYRKKAQLPQK